MVCTYVYTEKKACEQFSTRQEMHIGQLSILNFIHTVEDCRKKWMLLVVSAGRDVLMREPHRSEWTWCAAHFSHGLVTSNLC